MAFTHTQLIEVKYAGRTVGALAPGTGVVRFQYDAGWLRSGLELAPFLMPVGDGPRVYEFRGLRPETFFTLPPMIADSLPDRFGNRIIDAWMAAQGVGSGDISPLDRLAYINGRAMGALEFHPENGPGGTMPTIVDLAQLTDAARAALSGHFEEGGSDTAKALQAVLQVGTSAGGARPKAVLNVDDRSGEFSAGALPPREGESAWLLKFDGATDARTLAESKQYTRIEYAYYLMARAAGITLSESRLAYEGGRAHFMTRRFDRPTPGTRVHMTTLCGLKALDNDDVGIHDYAQLFQTVLELKLGEEALRETFRRMVFNVAAVNHDDHTKNHSFVMDDTGAWTLAPAYDLTYSNVPGHPYMGQHCMGVSGEFSAITDEHMLQLADRFEVAYAKSEIKKVREAIASWPDFAKQAGVPKDQVVEVQQAHQTLGRGIG